MAGGPEFQPKGAEHSGEIEKAAGEQLEKLKKQEHAGEKYDESEARQSIEKARVETEAAFAKEQSAGEQKAGGEPSGGPQHKVVTAKDREKSYKQTMKNVQDEMSAPARTFSKVIHNPVVEKTSEALGSTVARPNAILAGSVTAFLVVGAVYVLARNMGYELSGSETMVAFACGWLLGILFDFFRVMITGKR